MVPLTTLLLTYALARLVFGRRADRTLPGRLALATMLGVTGAAHFTTTDALVAMVPHRSRRRSPWCTRRE